MPLDDVKQPEAKPDATPAPDAKPTAPVTPAADAAKPVADPASAPSTPDPKAAVKPPATSVLDDADGEDDDGEAAAPTETPKQVVPANWPEDWRTKLAGADEKLMKRLERFADPGALMKSWLAAEQKISSGEYKKAQLPEDATEEQKAEWRKQNDIPEKPAQYDLPVVPGHQWSEDDKPVLEQFFAASHAANVPNAVMKQQLEWYAQTQLAAKERIAGIDQTDKATVEDAMRAELGPEYRPSMKLVRRLFDDPEWLPKDSSEKLLSARTADGRRIINDTAVMNWLLGIARDRYGDAVMIAGDAGKTVRSRIDEIKAIRANDINEYYNKGLDKELYDLESKMSKSGRRAA